MSSNSNFKDAIQEVIEAMVADALSGSFQDSLVYGSGYIKVTDDANGIQIKHVPFKEMEQELERVKEINKWTM